MDAQTFKSPARKLIRFFQRSRDNWKRKYMELKRERKKLSNQVRAVEKSRDHWKEVAREERRRVNQLERELADKKRKRLNQIPSDCQQHAS
jgi:predicted RNase H-like nuclease (RuvC/YqgF family)